MNKRLIFFVVLAIALVALFFVRRAPEPAPPTEPPAVVTAVETTKPAPPVVPGLTAPPTATPAPPSTATAATDTAPSPGEKPPAPTPVVDPDSLLIEDTPPPPGAIDMAAQFKEQMLNQVRTQTAAQHKLHYSDFSDALPPGDSQRLQELLLDRRMAMVEVGIAAQLNQQQPDPGAIAGAYSANEGDIQALLGDEYQAFVNYEMGMQDRIELDSIVGVFTSDEAALSELQRDQLLALMQEERQSVGLAFRWDSPEVMDLFQGDVPAILTKHHDMYKAIGARAGEVLTQRQAEALRNFYEERLGSMMNSLNALPRQAPPEQ
ncbi:MAG: hypothetical protein ACI8W8_005000 [Rhodothermales bacterium]|jgi:hypothetical protein